MQKRVFQVTVPPMCILYLYLMTLLFILIHVVMVTEIDCLDGVHTLDLP